MKKLWPMLLVALSFSSSASLAEDLPKISCRQGFVTASSSSPRNNNRENMIDQYLQVLDRNIFLEHNVSNWSTLDRDEFQIKIINLTPISKATLKQNLADGWQSQLVFQKDANDPQNCFDIHQEMTNRMNKKSRVIPIVGEAHRTCISSLSEGQTVFYDRTFIPANSGKTSQTITPYSICTINPEF